MSGKSKKRPNFNRLRVCASCQKKRPLRKDANICDGCVRALQALTTTTEPPAGHKPVDTHGLADLPIAHDNLNFDGSNGEWILLTERKDGAAFRTHNTEEKSLRCIATLADIDGLRWLHVSVSQKSKIPSWDDLRYIKEQVIGDRKAFIVLPKFERYVNIHPYCLHLWVPIDHDPLPDFEVMLGGQPSI